MKETPSFEILIAWVKPSSKIFNLFLWFTGSNILREGTDLFYLIYLFIFGVYDDTKRTNTLYFIALSTVHSFFIHLFSNIYT